MRKLPLLSTVLVLLGLASCLAPVARAVPASPRPVEVVQPDGTRFLLRLRGDEYFSWHETDAGYAVTQDSDGYWKFATPVAGQAKFGALAGARVGTANPAALGLTKHAMPEATLVRQTMEEHRSELETESAEQAVPSGGLRMPSSGSSSTPGPRVVVHGIKTVKNIVILACFANHWDSGGGTVSTNYGRVDIGEYSNLFNQIGYSADGAVGSVKDYYRDVSYGKMTLDSVITMWVRLPSNEVYYGEHTASGGHDIRAGQMVLDAINAAAAAGFDFSQGDTDGDGWVDCLTVLHSGFDEAAGGGTNCIWSHKGGITKYGTNGVYMAPYHTESALRGTNGSSITRIGTTCHELGHFFGLPDLYDTAGNSGGLGGWCLMSSASWNGDSGSRPGHMSAWCKTFLGFAKTVPVHSWSGASLPRVEDNPVVGLLRDGVTNGEYFLIENRAKVGFDNDSAIHPGLIIYHIDGKSFGNNSSTLAHPGVKMEEADGDDSLGFPDTTGSEAGDVWTSSSGLGGGFRDMTGTSNTTAMMYFDNPPPYQTNLFYWRTNNPALYTYNTLDNFSAAASNMSYDATTLKPTPFSRCALPTNFTISWKASSQAAMYEVQEGARVVTNAFFDGAENDEAMWANWYIGGVQRFLTNASYAGTGSYYFVNGRSLILQKPFMVQTNTVLSFYVASRIVATNGLIRCEISKDGGDTWKKLSEDWGYVTWTNRSYNCAAITNGGTIATGDLCIVHFVCDIEYASAYAGYPNNGFAIDNVSITGTEIACYGGWTSLDSNVTTNAYAVGARTNGIHAYRVQAYANGAWQGFGSEGEITIDTNHPPVFTNDPARAADAHVGAAYSASVTGLVYEADINDALTFSLSGGPAWLSLATNGTLSGVPSPADFGMNVFTVRVTDAAGAFDEAQLNVFVGSPPSGLNTNLVAYLPFDADFLDYSGRNNHPAQSNSNGRAIGLLGGNGYVLSTNGYLSFGMASDLHFSDDTAGNAESFSISFWAKLPGGSYSGHPVYVANKNWSTDTNAGWALASGPGAGTNGVFQMNYKEVSAYSRDYDSTSGALTNGWHHYLVVFKRDPTRVAFTYVDGVPVQSNSLYAAGTGIDSAGLPVNIGQDGTGTGTRGAWIGGTAMMDDFAFWRRALTAADAAAIYLAGTNGYGVGFAEAAPVITNITPDTALTSYRSVVNLRVGVLSGTSPSYQWRLGGVPVSGATSASLGVTNEGVADARSYDVVVSNAYGSATSAVVVVTLGAAAGVELTSPADGSIYDEPATIQLAATTVSHGTTVEDLRFYNGASVLATSAVAPHVFSWTNVSPGTYVLSARVDYNASATSTSAPVSVTVNWRPPTAVNDSATATQNTAATIAVLANDSDPYGPVGIASVTQPSRGTAAVAGPNVTYTPRSVTYGVDTFTYTVTNMYGRSATGTVTVTTLFPDVASAYSNAIVGGGAVAYWRFNESSGTNAADAAGAFRGTNNGSIVVGVSGVRPPPFAGFETNNTAYQFSSNTTSATSVAVPALNLNTNTITITAWLKRSGTQPSDAGIFMWRGTATAGFRLGAANELRFSWNGYVYTSTLTVPDNQWTFAALVISPSNGLVYLSTNSALMCWTNAATNVAAAFSGTSYIGYDSGGSTRRFNGVIDEVAVFNRALTAAQLGDLLTAAQTARPDVTLVTPTNGSVFAVGESVPLAASIATNGNHTIEKVQFVADSTNVVAEAQGGSGSWTSVWTSAGSGVHSLIARVLYDGANSNDSSSIRITKESPALRTLTIVSGLGTVSPAAGVYTNAEGTALTNSAAAPPEAGGTQFVCLGWVMSGNEPQSGTTNVLVMTVTNDAVLSWLWATNYWLETTSGSNGSVNVASGWRSAGATTAITATAGAYYHFTNWSGSVSSSANPLDLLMSGAQSVTANFAENAASNGTPEWWLAQYGWTNGFDSAETNDVDGDGMPTWEECVAGTIPTDGTSRLDVQVGAAARVGTAYELAWPSVSDRYYGVSWRTNLLDVPSDLVTDLPGTPPMNRYTDTVHNAEGLIYYRIRVRR